MESSQTPPPGGGPVEPTPTGAPAPAAPATDDGKAGAGARIGAVLLALVLALICAVAIGVMADVGDKGTCDELNAVTGIHECYDFSESVKPIVLGAGWIGAVLAGVAALMALVFTIRGRGGRILALTTVAAVSFLAISIAFAQVS
jgi:hypothetical protein